ncbi:ADP-ribose glycohydrolase OARD1 isoform X2 [Kryptolebias marmoratus]|uniref:ADP-ribose glycohydrolase OARD1 isoform X2 n=1 Tax=Kryptolebias marmoratus TaxID=37003 RepID=UPI000D52FA34|nr:ADP-ribose glycohydrolase OARD1 isoform X2 [Kryptolebias marmoratus]
MSSDAQAPSCTDTPQLAEGSWTPFYVTGDLFSCPADEALAHCISEDCRMGAGIAVLFRRRFGGVSELKEQKKLTGQCAVLKRDRRFVYYLILISDYKEKRHPEAHLRWPEAESGGHEVSLCGEWSDKNINASVCSPVSPIPKKLEQCVKCKKKTTTTTTKKQ